MSNWMGLNAPEYEIVNQLKREVAALRAEIERKDNAINNALDFLYDGYFGSAKMTLSEVAQEALSTEEGSDDS